MSKEMREQINKVKNWKQFLNENKSYITKDYLRFTVDVNYFKDNGYMYQELFGRDIPHYHKKLNNDHHIWCNLKDNEIHVNDWYDFLTPTILNYYIQNRNSDKVKSGIKFPDFKYISCRINRDTGEIKTKDEIFKELNGDAEITVDTLNKYQNSIYPTEWSELVLSIRVMDILLEEINRLTNNKFK